MNNIYDDEEEECYFDDDYDPAFPTKLVNP